MEMRLVWIMLEGSRTYLAFVEHCAFLAIQPI